MSYTLIYDNVNSKLGRSLDVATLEGSSLHPNDLVFL